jgi:hypothetical protein
MRDRVMSHHYTTVDDFGEDLVHLLDNVPSISTMLREKVCIIKCASAGFDQTLNLSASNSACFIIVFLQSYCFIEFYWPNFHLIISTAVTSC